MKIIYEFDTSDSDSIDERKLFENAASMHSALWDIREYIRTIEKGYCEDDKEKIVEKLYNFIWESKMDEIP